MVTSSIIKHLFSDKESLTSYLKNENVTFDDIKRRLLLMERMENRNVPDHYYRLNQTKTFKGIESLGETIRLGLYRIADDHLEFRDKRIYVKQEKQNDWQELITRIPPLILQAAFLHIKNPIKDTSPHEILNYFSEWILPNAKYTALPFAYIPQLENYIDKKKGFHDLHIHLNGSIETDLAWQNFLFEPNKIYKELEKSFKNPKVKEQFEQESNLLNPLEFRDLLISARRIRSYLFNMIFPNNGVNSILSNLKFPEQIISKFLNTDNLLSNKENPFPDSYAHPFSSLIYKEYYNRTHLMAVEGLMFILVFRYLAETERNSIANIFHFYLLILGLSNRLLVQQTHQFGFEQFQKNTVNNLRSNSEKEYTDRFFQLHGNDKRNISFIEGRFAPKITRDENLKIMSLISKGWSSLMNNIKQELNLPDNDLPQLKLIAHFIKEADRNPDKEIRHKKLRYEVWEKAKVLSFLKQNHTSCMKDIVAIDAAASEFDTPPEVFAPAFRFLRRNGFKHFTYHAGEDFFCIIGGLRAIYEAVVFNELRCGDRIGHATAAGVSPNLWIRNIGHHIFIHRGEYLDDLLFVYHLIIIENIDEFKPVLPLIKDKIEELSHIIYRRFYSIKNLEEAWLLRRFSPAILFSSSQSQAQLSPLFDFNEWCEIQNRISNNMEDERIEVLRKYHNIDYRKDYDEIIKIKTNEFFDDKNLEKLQLVILKFLHKKEIIIETLPTSNVRIGHHNNYGTYHLWNWNKWETEGHSIPPIVVGTDDAGIFATNIYIEYANIYCYLTCQYKMTHNKAMELIERLDKNGQIYKFE